MSCVALYWRYRLTERVKCRHTLARIQSASHDKTANSASAFLVPVAARLLATVCDSCMLCRVQLFADAYE